MEKDWTRAWEKSSHRLALVLLPGMLWLLVWGLPGLAMAQEEKAPASSTAKDKPKDPLSPKKGGTREIEKASQKKGGTREGEQTAHAKPSAGGSKTAASGKATAGTKSHAKKTANHGSTTADKPEHPE